MWIKCAYVVDKRQWERVNAEGKNYWWIYIEEIIDRLGLTAERISPEEVGEKIESLSLVIAGDCDMGRYSEILDRWVRKGGVLVGSNTEGLDEVFSIRCTKRIPQEAGPFAITGKFFLQESPFTASIHSPIHPQAPLLAVSPLRPVSTVNAEKLAVMGDDALITAHKHGNGWAFYFGFNLGQTFWTIQQGRPIDRDYDGDGFLRVSDSIIIGDNNYEVGYTDELLFLLQNMVGVLPLPLIHQLPPADGKVPDALFYYGGDEEASGSVVCLPASRFMKEQGLPYHINIMPNSQGVFVVPPKDAEVMEKNGTEISLHFNFVDNYSPVGMYSQKDVEKQTRDFIRTYKKQPVCSVMHCTTWNKWYEPAEWMGKAGLLADNSKVPRRSPPSNPVNEIGFSFGTSFPFHYWTDWLQGNKRLEFLELPITAYECGYLKEETDFGKLEKILTLALHYNLLMNLFYHPVYIAKYPACRQAIMRFLDMIRERNIRVIHSTPDRVTRWWFARSASRIEDISIEDDSMNFNVLSPSTYGCIVKIPLGEKKKVAGCSVDYEVKESFSRRWAYLIIPPGEHRLHISFGV